MQELLKQLLDFVFYECPVYWGIFCHFICRCFVAGAARMSNHHWEEDARVAATVKCCSHPAQFAGCSWCVQPMCSRLASRWCEWFGISVTSQLVLSLVLASIVLINSLLHTCIWYLYCTTCFGLYQLCRFYYHCFHYHSYNYRWQDVNSLVNQDYNFITWCSLLVIFQDFVLQPRCVNRD